MFTAARKLAVFASLFAATSAFAQTQKPLEGTEDLALMHITVTDMEGNIRPAEWVQFEGIATKKSVEAISDKQGKLSVLLPEGDTYVVRVKGWGSEEEFTRVEIPATAGVITGELGLKYEPEQSFTLDDVHFETAKAKLRTESFPALDELAKVLALKPQMRIEIAGHTDDIGDDAGNLQLSKDRAKSVVEYLVKKGISADRLIFNGYGETQPIADNKTPEGRALNRRTEARILAEQ